VADDLERPDLPELDWSARGRAASLSAVFEHARGLGNKAEQWYAEKRPTKKRWGRVLRLGALLLGFGAVILPILMQIYTTDGEPAIAPAWAAIALAAAATLIALDHFLGFSSGWMRFMAAEMHLTALRHEFEYAWNERIAAAAEPRSDADVRDLLALARTFVLAVDRAVAEETGTWLQEFRGVLEGSEQSLKAKP
jgi:hypothetical protein